MPRTHSSHTTLEPTDTPSTIHPLVRCRTPHHLSNRGCYQTFHYSSLILCADMPHPQYPRLLPQSALRPLPLLPLETPLKTHITATLESVPVEITRVFLALCNYNLLAHASIADRQYVNRLLQNASARDITRLGEQFSRAVRQCVDSISLLGLYDIS